MRFILPSALKCFDLLKKNNYLQQLNHDEFVKGLADFFCELNVVHPFREGNGRSLRLFCEVLALQAGYELSWKDISQQTWLHANISRYQGNLLPLIQLFKKSSIAIE